jgi:hypothetical protein
VLHPLLQQGLHLGDALLPVTPESQNAHQPPRVLLYSCSIISLLTVITRELAW